MSFDIRFRYARDESLQYIAHLDMLRLFERTLRRSGLPVAHTQGFNPRMKLVFGLPMSIGLSSEAEYADIEMDQPVSCAHFLATMNTHLPEGMRVLEAVALAGRDNVMMRVAAARYDIRFRILGNRGTSLSDASSQPEGSDPQGVPGMMVMEPLLVRMLEAEHVPVMKKGKKGLREVNIRPWIYTASLSEVQPGEWKLEAFLSAGAEDNLRPDLLMTAWEPIASLRFEIQSLRRTALYASVDNEWLPLTDPRACGGHAG